MLASQLLCQFCDNKEITSFEEHMEYHDECCFTLPKLHQFVFEEGEISEMTDSDILSSVSVLVAVPKVLLVNSTLPGPTSLF